ncbi:MAG: lysophospholipid acyltransferase family protein [bacterium]|nr:lysophospholipid acyltransferase family protein [bacterium]
MRERLRILFLVWTIGLVGGLIFMVLRVTGRVKISGFNRKKLKLGEKGLIVISNHPSLWEPGVIPFLFFPGYLFSLRLVPVSVVDKADYYNSGWFSPFRFACLPVERRNTKEEMKAMGKMLSHLERGGVLIIYPEAGRTFKGEEFRYSSSGERIRCFPKGLRKLFLESGSPVLPLWTKGGDRIILNELAHPRFPHFTFPRIWRVLTIRFGDLIEVNGTSREEVIGMLEDTLLKLGEK